MVLELFFGLILFVAGYCLASLRRPRREGAPASGRESSPGVATPSTLGRRRDPALADA